MDAAQGADDIPLGDMLKDMRGIDFVNRFCRELGEVTNITDKIHARLRLRIEDAPPVPDSLSTNMQLHDKQPPGWV